MHKGIKDFAFKYGSFARNSDILFYLNSWRPSFRKKMVGKNTSLCIEGFQRSGNTYFGMLFRHLHPTHRVAHNIHGVAHISKAIKMKIPIVVLIRQPIDVLSSLITYDENLSIDVAIKAYLDYHNKLLPLRSNICLVRFEDLISDFNSQIKKVNRQFHTDFKLCLLSTEEIKLLMNERQSKYSFERSKPFPNQFKTTRNKAHKDQITKHPLFQKAELVYQQLLN